MPSPPHELEYCYRMPSPPHELEYCYRMPSPPPELEFSLFCPNYSPILDSESTLQGENKSSSIQGCRVFVKETPPPKKKK